MPVNYEKDLLLVTCASGKQATELVPHLYGKWKKLRLQVVSDSSKERLSKQYPNAEVVQAELTDPSACNKLLEGVTAVFLICPPWHPKETACGLNILDAAKSQARSNGPITHIVYSSVLHPILRKMLNHDCKRYVEEALVESGIPHTILQPTHLNDTFPLAKLMQEDKPVYEANWDPEVKFSFCATKDLGEAGARVLEQREKHYWATYEMVSTPASISYTEAVKIVGEEIGKEVQIKRRSYEEAVEFMIGMVGGATPHGRDPETKEIGKRMILYYNERGLVGNCNVMEMVLGRKPLSYRDWVREKVGELKGQ